MSADIINPLIVGEGWNDDTASNVQGAIEFIADALTVINRTGGLTEQTAFGAGRLLMCCAAAIQQTREVAG